MTDRERALGLLRKLRDSVRTGSAVQLTGLGFVVEGFSPRGIIAFYGYNDYQFSPSRETVNVGRWNTPGNYEEHHALSVQFKSWKYSFTHLPGTWRESRPVPDIEADTIYREIEQALRDVKDETIAKLDAFLRHIPQTNTSAD